MHTKLPELLADALLLYPAGQWENPCWDKAGKCHDWRNHIPEDLCEIWTELTLETRATCMLMAQGMAEREDGTNCPCRKKEPKMIGLNEFRKWVRAIFKGIRTTCREYVEAKRQLQRVGPSIGAKDMERFIHLLTIASRNVFPTTEDAIRNFPKHFRSR